MRYSVFLPLFFQQVSSCVATAYVQPYETAWLNLLDTLGLFALIVTQILSIVYFYAAQAAHPFMDPGAIELIVTLVLFALNVAVMLVFLVCWVSEMANVRDALRKARSDVLKVSVLLFTVTLYANHAHNLTRSP
jgi:hypothetical protein